MALAGQLSSAVKSLIEEYQGVAQEKAANGGFTFLDACRVITGAIVPLMKACYAFRNFADQERKVAVLAAIGEFYDAVIAPIDIKAVPNFIEGLADAAIKQILLTVAETMVDALIKFADSLGDDEPTPGPGPFPPNPFPPGPSPQPRPYPDPSPQPQPQPDDGGWLPPGPPVGPY